jgi:hypothetical protein
LFFSLAAAGWAALVELVPNWDELCGTPKDGAAGAVLVVAVGAWLWLAAGCANNDFDVAVGDALGAAAVGAGAAVLNGEGVDVAVVVAPNSSDGTADGAVADGCEVAVVAGVCPKRLVVAGGCEAGVDVAAGAKRFDVADG